MKRYLPGLAIVLCLAGMGPAAAFPSLSAQDDPDLQSVQAEIAAKRYDAALTELQTLVLKYPQADVFSLMGFVLRKTGDRAQAMTYYRKALDAEPLHRGALEYQGELYIELGQLVAARENLAKLAESCPLGCEEATDLKEAIDNAAQPK